MKVYLFDTDNGLFSGEDYCEPREVSEVEGITTVPPPDRKPGTVPIFDRATGQWKLVPKYLMGGNSYV